QSRCDCWSSTARLPASPAEFASTNAAWSCAHLLRFNKVYAHEKTEQAACQENSRTTCDKKKAREARNVTGKTSDGLRKSFDAILAELLKTSGASRTTLRLDDAKHGFHIN